MEERDYFGLSYRDNDDARVSIYSELNWRTDYVNGKYQIFLKELVESGQEDKPAT